MYVCIYIYIHIHVTKYINGAWFYVLPETFFDAVDCP